MLWGKGSMGFKYSLELDLQRLINLRHGRRYAEIGEAGDAVIAHAAGNDAGVVFQVGRDVEADPVKADPAAQSDADRGDLGVVTTLWPMDPNPYAIHPALAPDTEFSQGCDDPALQTRDERTDIGLAAVQIQHHVGDPLTWTMIGELATPSGAVNREALWIQQIHFVGTGAGGVDRRMFKEPDQLGRTAH